MFCLSTMQGEILFWRGTHQELSEDILLVDLGGGGGEYMELGSKLESVCARPGHIVFSFSLSPLSLYFLSPSLFSPLSSFHLFLPFFSYHNDPSITMTQVSFIHTLSKSLSPRQYRETCQCTNSRESEARYKVRRPRWGQAMIQRL